MKRPSFYVITAASLATILGAVGTGLLWLEGHGKLLPEGLALWVLPLIFVALPGTFLMAIVLPHHAGFAVSVGLVINFFLYWLLFRALVAAVSFYERRSSGR